VKWNRSRVALDEIRGLICSKINNPMRIVGLKKKLELWLIIFAKEINNVPTSQTTDQRSNGRERVSCL
jgi:hypothetical protein